MTYSGNSVYPGIYKAYCVADVNPYTVSAYVAQVFGQTLIKIIQWTGDKPFPGDSGYVSFEGGDASFPVWHSSKSSEQGEPLYVATRDATGEPTGHTDRDQSTISFDDTSRRFTIAPATGYDYFEVWCAGISYRKVSPEYVVLPDVSGSYYIYYAADGVLNYKTSPFDLSADAPTAYIYWNSSAGKVVIFADERHGIVLDWQTHQYLHRTRGTALASGFDASNYILGGSGSSNTHAQIDIADGVMFDEDIQISISNSATPTANTWQQYLQGPAKIPVFYRSDTLWTYDTPTNFPLKQGTALPRYNTVSAGSWSTVDASNNKYLNMYIVATDNLNYPIISIMGQAEYSNQASAEDVAFNDLDTSGLPIYEFRPLYHLVFRVSTSYSNTPHASLYAIIDNRSVQVVGVTTTANSVSGTTDQVYVNGGTAAQTGNVTLSLPQSINTTSSPSFSAVSATGNVSGLTITSTASTGTSPLTVASTTLVSNLNADLLDGQHASFYMPPGAIQQYAGLTAPSGWLLCIGQSLSRTTYADLFNAVTNSKGTVTLTIATPCVLTLNSHGLVNGDAVYLTTTGALPTGLSANTTYYVQNAAANTFNLNTSQANAIANSATGRVATSGTQSGTHTIVQAPWGGITVTNFAIPDLRGRVGVGLDSMGGTDAGRLSVNNAVGLSGGEESHTLTSAEMPVHSHANTLSDPTHRHQYYINIQHGDGTPVSGESLTSGLTLGGVRRYVDYTEYSSTGISITNANAGGSSGVTQAHNVMQPYVLLNYIIKT